MAAPLRAAFLAFSAKSYGADSHFKSLLPAIGRKKDLPLEIRLLAANDNYRNLCRESGVRFERFDFPGLQNGIVRTLWEQLVLPFYLKREKIDVVYTTMHAGLLFSSTPCITAVCNMENLMPPTEGSSWKHRIRLKLLRWFTLTSAHRAARVIAVSNFVKETLTREGVPAEKIDVVYYGVEHRNVGAGLRDKPFVLSAGKFIRYMNLETLFRCFAEMKKRGYCGQLRFAGGGQDPLYEIEIRNLVAHLDIEKEVEFLGYIDRERLRSLMRICDVFLFTSKLEACPFTLLEAMREGAAILTASTPPMPEHCEGAARYCAPDDYADWGKTAMDIIANEALREDLRRKALKRADYFSWDDNIRGLAQSIERAVLETR
jgi:glycosyltransferase involved in cell wall biosynthesis